MLHSEQILKSRGKLLIKIFLWLLLIDGYPILAQEAQNVKYDLVSEFVNGINLCKWRNGAEAGVNFSFDDPQDSHLEISKILDRYNYKATFFLNARKSSNYFNTYRDILKRGHEIGNHTLSHRKLIDLDSLYIVNEVYFGKKFLEDSFGIKCVSFSAPYHKLNDLAKTITFYHHLFIRNTSIYPKASRMLVPIVTTRNMSGIMKDIRNGMKNNAMLLLAGHGIDSVGFEPITADFLCQICDTIKYYEKLKKIWVAPLKEVALYESLMQEITLDKSI